MDDPIKAPAAELAAAIRRRELGALEVLEAYLARGELLDGTLNALVERRSEEARVEARALDAALAAGEPVGPLAGVPVTVKEAIASEGLSWTDGSRLWQGRKAPADAPAVARLRRAGAIQLGVTNVPEFCSYYDTDNDLYGRTVNPHDRVRTSGGSSGGESAAISAGLSALGLGSDLGSSIRNPASWTGIFGLRPSRGLVPHFGHTGSGLAPAIRLFGTIGPMARTAGDLALALGVIADLPPTPLPAAPVRVAVYEEDGLQPVARSCREAVRAAAAALADCGHELHQAAPPAAEQARQLFQLLLGAELVTLAGPDLGERRELLSRYGREAVALGDGFEPDLAVYLRGASAQAELERAADAWLEQHPIALSPVTPVTAPLAAEGIRLVDGEPARPGGKLTLATYANVFGLPAVSVPAGRDGDGLPLAVQVMGRRGHDLEVLAVAAELEQALGGWLDPDESPASVTRPA